MLGFHIAVTVSFRGSGMQTPVLDSSFSKSWLLQGKYSYYNRVSGVAIRSQSTEVPERSLQIKQFSKNI